MNKLQLDERIAGDQVESLHRFNTLQSLYLKSGCKCFCIAEAESLKSPTADYEATFMFSF